MPRFDEVILQRTGATDYYFTHDYRYSVTSLTNSAGNIVESYDYKVYGERTCSGSGLTEVGYTGQRHDSETGLMYFKNRYYSVSMGQFVTRDPLGYVDGLSMYLGYFGGQGRDPFGLADTESALDPITLKNIMTKSLDDGNITILVNTGELKYKTKVKGSDFKLKIINAIEIRVTSTNIDCTKIKFRQTVWSELIGVKSSDKSIEKIQGTFLGHKYGIEGKHVDASEGTDGYYLTKFSTSHSTQTSMFDRPSSTFSNADGKENSLIKEKYDKLTHIFHFKTTIFNDDKEIFNFSWKFTEIWNSNDEFNLEKLAAKGIYEIEKDEKDINK